jgi:hypothetical protein|eukprot:CCRYP_020846-RD/>CCRYP_020846-RD protein AED:0.50 eAED:0.50 QI:0/-1/0/1/-1/0/1/0/4
MMRS